MKTSSRFALFAGILVLLSLLLLSACGGGGGSGDVTAGDDISDDGTGDGGTPPVTDAGYTLLAWNDLGMHCLNPTYDTLVILPPYNTVWAQLVRRGSPPQLVTSGVTLDYRVVNNTSSADKTNPAMGSDFGQFWTYVQQLFGVSLAPDTGLNLVDPTLHNGLAGTLVQTGSHFEVDGIPLTPVDDSNVWNPYQVIEITAKDGSGNVLATTRATVPTSDEIRCATCHGSNAFADILAKHDADVGTGLAAATPVLCASCHGSPALGTSGPGSAGIYLSQAIHGFHADKSTPLGAAIGCYDCHPGTTTRCNRSIAHTAADGNCTTCHGSLQQLAAGIAAGRIPWASEPKCSDCHGGVAEVDTGTTLYRNASGHGGLGCPACHGSPHAMVPSSQASDNYQAIQYQGKALSLSSCAVCHATSRGAGLSEFLEEHGGTSHPSACGVCHTTITTIDTTLWPHHFEWQSR